MAKPNKPKQNHNNKNGQTRFHYTKRPKEEKMEQRPTPPRLSNPSLPPPTSPALQGCRKVETESPQQEPRADVVAKVQTIQQQRAAHALKKINGFPSGPEFLESRKRFKSYASALPAMIHMNGLGQTAAFCLSKGGEYKILYDLLSEWLTKPDQPYRDQKSLIDAITQCDMHAYRLAQAEAIALLEWVKKFADAFLSDPENKDEGNGEKAS